MMQIDLTRYMGIHAVLQGEREVGSVTVSTEVDGAAVLELEVQMSPEDAKAFAGLEQASNDGAGDIELLDDLVRIQVAGIQVPYGVLWPIRRNWGDITFVSLGINQWRVWFRSRDLKYGWSALLKPASPE